MKKTHFFRLVIPPVVTGMMAGNAAAVEPVSVKEEILAPALERGAE